MDEATLEANVAGIGALLGALLPTASASGEPGLAAPLVLNNMAWFGGMSLLDFLRDVGKHARVGVMLSKDSVKARMGTPGAEGEAGEGMSYTEFTYQLLQACVPCFHEPTACFGMRASFLTCAFPRAKLRLFVFVQGARRVGPGALPIRDARLDLQPSNCADLPLPCCHQIGGSDQWGNITAGTDLIRRVQQRDGAIGACAVSIRASGGESETDARGAQA
jgi:hypothetical protein